MTEPWSQEEVELVVEDYRRMLICQLNGQAYSKAEHSRLLRERLNGRSKGSVEYKHQNITAILKAIGFPFTLTGYPPMGNFQRLLYEVVVDRLLDDRSFELAATHATDKPAEAPLGVDFAYWIDMPPKPSGVAEPNVAPITPTRVDYIAREARNRALGRAGEELVLAFERERLERAGKDHLASRVEHTSANRGDGAGFDVLSFENDGRERFIEVKTTAFAKATPFFMSRNEVDFSSQRPDSYHLYRLFEFRAAPRMFMLKGDMRTQLTLDAVSYRASVAG